MGLFIDLPCMVLLTSNHRELVIKLCERRIHCNPTTSPCLHTTPKRPLKIDRLKCPVHMRLRTAVENQDKKNHRLSPCKLRHISTASDNQVHPSKLNFVHRALLGRESTNLIGCNDRFFSFLLARTWSAGRGRGLGRRGRRIPGVNRFACTSFADHS